MVEISLSCHMCHETAQGIQLPLQHTQTVHQEVFSSGRYKVLSAPPGKNCSLSSSLCPAGSLDDLKTLLHVISIHVL